MASGLLVRFRPVGPWRLGPDNGARSRSDSVFHSDSLFSALTAAMRDLGWTEEWLSATARSASPSVRLSSCYPYTGRTLLIQPPRSVWPPAHTGKLRWKAARFVPVPLVPALLRDEDLSEEQWAVDPISECLLPILRGAPAQAPFRVVRRAAAAVDRVTGTSEAKHVTTCLQFASGAGMWFAAAFTEAAQDEWEPRLRAAARLLADTGIGGGRSRGWGRSRAPQFEDVDLPGFLSGDATVSGAETAWWTVSLFSPGEHDAVQWDRGNYAVTKRTGRMESYARWGDLKPAQRMVAEGSVLLSGAPLFGAIRQVFNGDMPHPVYRSGIALAVPIPWRESHRLPWLVEREAPVPEPKPEAAPPAEPQVVMAPPEEPLLLAEPHLAGLLEQPAEPLPAEVELPEQISTEEPGPESPPAEEPGPEPPPMEEPPAEEPETEEPPVEEPGSPAPPVKDPGDEEPRT